MTCKYCNQPSPQEYYNTAMSIAEPKFRIFTIFGRTAEQLLEALKCYDERNKQMTRKEAINKMMEIFRSDVEDSKRNIADFIDGLEALGLIKFEEEKTVDSPSMIIKKYLDAYTFQSMLKADEIVNALMQAGYKIVRKDHG